MRVLMVIPGSENGNTMIFAKRQAKCLQSYLGVDVKTFHLGCRTSLLGIAREMLRFRREIAAFKPECVHAQYGTMTSIFARLGTALPVVVTFRGSDLNGSCEVGRVRSFAGVILSQLAALMASSIICVSAMLRERLWWRRRKVAIIASGVDTDLFLPMHKADARKCLGWNPDEHVILFNCGGAPKTKRLDLALGAVAEAEALLGSEIRLHVLTGDTHSSLVPTIMNASDCVLVTSDHEGSPTIIQEALACNTPVVTVRVGDSANMVADIPGCYIVSRSPADNAVALVEILRSRAKCAGRSRAIEKSLKQSCMDTAHCYEAAVRQ
jgi:teichuronic acid biosynthesis glycosyltransferase TuaC